jgi:Fur family ferric uptake transcriptional regulator
MIAATQSNHPLAGVAPAGSASAVEIGVARLRAHGLRITKPRVALLETLARQSGPVAIEQLHEAVSREACDLVTVYRCLAAFEDIGLVRRSFLHNGTSLYELVLGAAPQHYHLICKSCGKTDRVDYFPIEGVERVLRERGYTHVSHLVEFFGLCPACQAKLPTRQVTPPVAPRPTA